MSEPTIEELAVRAVLKLLWEVLQPHHFLIGFVVGSLVTMAAFLLVWATPL